MIIQLGATFEGSISRVELYDFVFDETLRTLVRNNDLIGVPPIIPWDNYERNNVLYVYPSEYCIADCPSRGRLRCDQYQTCMYIVMSPTNLSSSMNNV